MKLNTDTFDLWVYYKKDGIPKYLLLHTSQEKADKWFRGGRFWQVPGKMIQDGETLKDALIRSLQVFRLEAKAIWAAEHTYIIYNPRRECLETIPVFAAEVEGPQDFPLTWEHSEYGWFTPEECYERIHFRGLKEGLQWTRKYISEPSEPAKELRIL